ncbi:hypothetical protein D1007_13604 [Hordeum vulgare]|nr:hypothetical protein D1007_13604 [Hordeum vulgare]
MQRSTTHSSTLPLASLLVMRLLSVSLSPRRHRAVTPSRRRGTSGYCGVRAPYDSFYVEIHSGDMHLGLVTFDTVDNVVHAYDVAAWRLNRSHREMNFYEVMTQEWAQNLAPRPRVVSE